MSDRTFYMLTYFNCEDLSLRQVSKLFSNRNDRLLVKICIEELLNDEASCNNQFKKCFGITLLDKAGNDRDINVLTERAMKKKNCVDKICEMYNNLYIGDEEASFLKLQEISLSFFEEQEEEEEEDSDTEEEDSDTDEEESDTEEEDEEESDTEEDEEEETKEDNNEIDEQEDDEIDNMKRTELVEMCKKYNLSHSGSMDKMRENLKGILYSEIVVIGGKECNMYRLSKSDSREKGVIYSRDELRDFIRAYNKLVKDNEEEYPVSGKKEELIKRLDEIVKKFK